MWPGLRVIAKVVHEIGCALRLDCREVGGDAEPTWSSIFRSTPNTIRVFQVCWAGQRAGTNTVAQIGRVLTFASREAMESTRSWCVVWQQRRGLYVQLCSVLWEEKCLIVSEGRDGERG